MPKVVDTISNWLLIRETLKKEISLGFVPTMGSLHVGHESLLRKSNQENKCTILSLFVNPTQFDDHDDFKNYPRSIDKDIDVASSCNVDYIFTPSYNEIYPDGFSYKIVHTTPQYQEELFRIGHFEGVLTIVMKLLLLIKPTRSYFGAKDYQQLQLIKGLVKSFFLDTTIVECETVRDEFGLPLSSRNSRLSKEQMQLARRFSKIFHSPFSCDQIKEALIQEGIDIDYIEDHKERRFAAVRIGGIRLIDNIPL
ncbi:pantoate--beta-alanine ligase [Coxiella endosymbiont of Amblyomma sculptum]|uniref:pantoate--beta-alanine ligase n=1 Tax=Coxiella endosymbiont of Amblyomma sculptum TaxID=2487929 RepID=UPI00132F1055|nr:pantoate--beta-alanine ligase [Coxiella endosymbiont of Amblyomma sculptum]QHG92494.1 pantoate--beta-alanine ligase [Coxiella endosymbiont of Amblyomma sculptum]